MLTGVFFGAFIPAALLVAAAAKAPPFPMTVQVWSSNGSWNPDLAQLPGERDDDYPERPAFRSVQCWEMPTDPTLIRCTDGFWRRLLPGGTEMKGYERFEPPAERLGRSAEPVSKTER